MRDQVDLGTGARLARRASPSAGRWTWTAARMLCFALERLGLQHLGGAANATSTRTVLPAPIGVGLGLYVCGARSGCPIGATTTSPARWSRSSPPRSASALVFPCCTGSEGTRAAVGSAACAWPSLSASALTRSLLRSPVPAPRRRLLRRGGLCARDIGGDTARPAAAGSGARGAAAGARDRTSPSQFVPWARRSASTASFPPERRRTALLLAGALAGLLPLLTITRCHFGGPLTTVYSTARPEPHELPLLVAGHSVAAAFYLTEPTTASSSTARLSCSRSGLLLPPRELWRERLTIGAGAPLSFGHLLVVGGTGAAQFPPRPLIPHAAVPGASVRLDRVEVARRPARRLGPRRRSCCSCFPSIAFCMLGALGGTMFRDVARWNAWYVYLHNLVSARARRHAALQPAVLRLPAATVCWCVGWRSARAPSPPGALRRARRGESMGR